MFGEEILESSDSLRAFETSCALGLLPLNPLESQKNSKPFSKGWKRIIYHRFLDNLPGGVDLFDAKVESLTVLVLLLPSAAAFNLASISAFFRAMMAACSDIWENLSWPGGLDDMMEKNTFENALEFTQKEVFVLFHLLLTFVYNPDRKTVRKLSLSKYVRNRKLTKNRLFLGERYFKFHTKVFYNWILARKFKRSYRFVRFA